jgi:uncharacterized protein YndB with AHSA1/START domain
MQGRSSIVIAVPDETVFAFITDPANDRTWRSHLVASHGIVRGVGDRVTQTYSYQGRSQTVDLEVSEYEPPTRLTYYLTGAFRARFSFQCLPEAGGTRMGFSVSSVLTGPAALLEGRITTEVTKLARTDLERLKRVLESRT